MLGQKLMVRSVVSAMLLAGWLLVVGASSARADAFRDCQQKVGSAQNKLSSDIYRHGEHSRQAANDWVKLNKAHNWCASHGVRSEEGRNFRDRRFDRDRDYNRGRDNDHYNDRNDRNYRYDERYNTPYGR